MDNLKYALKEIPREKIICAISNYGYEWTTDGKAKLPQAAHTVSVQEAWTSAEESDADVDLDGDAMNPHFSFMEGDKSRHDVWFTDAVTALNQMRAARAAGDRHVCACGGWDRKTGRCGTCGTSRCEASAPDKLKDVPPGQDVDMEDAGEILQIEERPAPGQRTITVDKIDGHHFSGGFHQVADAVPDRALWGLRQKDCDYLRRRAGPEVDAEDHGGAGQVRRERDVLPDRSAGGEVFRR